MVPARGLKARAMSSEENPYIYVFKPKLMGMVHELALTQDSLDWVIGPGSGRVSYHMIKRIRLGDLPPLKWSSLKYGLTMEELIDGKEEAYS